MEVFFVPEPAIHYSPQINNCSCMILRELIKSLCKTNNHKLLLFRAAVTIGGNGEYINSYSYLLEFKGNMALTYLD